MKGVDNIEDFIKNQELKVRQKVRNKAFKNAESNLIYAGRKLNDLTPDEWQHILAEEEKAVWEKYMRGGIVSMIAIAFFGVP